MEISTSHSTHIAKPKAQAKGGPSPAKETKGSVARDVVALGVGAGAAVSGGIYGLGEGLVKGSLKNLPSHVRTAAKIGSAITTPAGGALGALATRTIAAAAATGAPVVSGLAVGLGLVGGTALSAAKQLPSSVTQTARAGAAWGARAGQVLGPIGAAAGGVVGGTVGG